jgi:hypothetical protein
MQKLAVKWMSAIPKWRITVSGEAGATIPVSGPLPYAALGQGGGEGVGIRIADGVEAVRGEGCADGDLVGAAFGFGQGTAVVAQDLHGYRGSRAIGGAQVLSGLAEGFGLLCVARGRSANRRRATATSGGPPASVGVRRNPGLLPSALPPEDWTNMG